MIAFSAPAAEFLRSTDCRIIVTGVGGWLGRATLEMLDAALGNDLGERVWAFASSERTLQLVSGRTIEVEPLERIRTKDARPSYVLHYAYLGKEKVAELGPERFTATNKEINDLVERYCERIPSGGLFFASSGAAHYAQGSADDSAREPYGASKLYDEARFLRLSSAEFPVVACRIFNLAGPYMNKLTEYALSCILVDIEKGGPIRLRANKPILRSYTHVRDVIDLVVALLINGAAPSGPFDSAGEDEVEIGELALRAATLLSAGRITIERPPLTVSPPDRYVGNGELFDSLMRKMNIRRALLDEQILDTARYLRERN